MTKLVPGILGIAAIAGLIFGAAPLMHRARGADPTPWPGAPAPAFTAKDIAGRDVSLGNYLGKTVILEWTNDGCPFVGKHYNSGNMQALQRRFTAEGDVWLTIASSAPGRQGYVTPMKPGLILRAGTQRRATFCSIRTGWWATSTMQRRRHIWW